MISRVYRFISCENDIQKLHLFLELIRARVVNCHSSYLYSIRIFLKKLFNLIYNDFVCISFYLYLFPVKIIYRRKCKIVVFIVYLKNMICSCNKIYSIFFRFLTGTTSGLRLGCTMMDKRNLFVEPWKKFTQVYQKLRNKDTVISFDIWFHSFSNFGAIISMIEQMFSRDCSAI